MLCTGKSSFGLVDSSAILGLILFSFCRLDFCSACSTAASTKALSILKMMGWEILEDISFLFAILLFIFCIVAFFFVEFIIINI